MALPAAGFSSLANPLCWFMRQRSAQLKLASPLSQGRLQFDLGAVDGFAGGGFFFLGQPAQLFQEGAKLAIRPEVADTGLFERHQVRGGSQVGEGRLLHRFDLVEESCHKSAASFPCPKSGARNANGRAVSGRPFTNWQWKAG